MLNIMLSQAEVDDDDDPTMIFIGMCDTLLFPMIIRLLVNVFFCRIDVAQV